MLQFSRRYEKALCSTHTLGGKGPQRKGVGQPTIGLTQTTASTWKFLRFPHPMLTV